MSNSKAYQTLCNTARVLIEGENYKELYDSLHNLYTFCATETGIYAESATDKDIYLSSGKAISPSKAAHCLLEVERTRKFVRGIYKAILMLKKNRGEKINILYAGTGPYSSLLLPLTTMFKPEDVSFYLLDINPVSLKAVEQLYAHLELTPYVNDFILADAACYKIPPDAKIHILLSETMQNALKKEPYVQIMRNLIPQLNPAAIVIPEEIVIDARLTSWKEEKRGFIEQGRLPERVHLGEIYRINREKYTEDEPVTIYVPEPAPGFSELSMFTEITVFGDEKLTAYNCGLNQPQPVGDARLFGGKKVQFAYIADANPHFDYTIL